MRAGPEPQSYKFFWKTGEEDERRKQMMALAADEVRAYAKALVKNRIAARPSPEGLAAAKGKPAKPAQPVLENIQFRAFDVWRNNQPVMILTAEAHSAAPAMRHRGSGPDSYSVTLVARTESMETCASCIRE